MSHRPINALLVEDDDPLRFLVVEALAQAGCDVVEAENGRAALEACRKQLPDIVLMDVVMPVMDGFTACAELRQLPGAAHVPILMMTGLEDEDSVDRAYQVGATDFVTKPINFALLVRRVRNMVRTGEITQQLSKSQHRLAEAQRVAKLGSWEWAVQEDRLTWSQQALDILGVNKAIATKGFSALTACIPAGELALVDEWLRDARAGNDIASLNHDVQRPDGDVRHIFHQVEAIRDANGQVTHLYGTLQDITTQHRAEQEIRRLAYFDTLTGLPNRAHFRQSLVQAVAQAIRYKRTGALLFIDLDDFKRINDTLGHHSGDLLLKSVAERITGSLRASDVILFDERQQDGAKLARLGGDEFTILLPEVGCPEDAAIVAQRLLDTVSRPVQITGHEVVTTPSVGITVFPQDGTSVDELLRNSDIAMYNAKHDGKATYKFFDMSMNEESLRRMVLESALRQALARQELCIHYQPQISVPNGDMVAVEALLRWYNPELGAVSPMEFIPLAEETGLILSIGEWVLRTACCQAQEWVESGIPIKRIAVNVSVRQFSQRNFAKILSQILVETGLSPAMLELEMTESLLMKQADAAIQTLDELKAIGVQLAIDDFGTGYSSLSYLKRFPIDRLKIDKAFVNNVDQDRDNAAITRAVIGMARNMELAVTAEGVETAEQLGFLRAKACDEYQGFFFSAPLPAEKIPQLFSSGSWVDERALLQRMTTAKGGEVIAPLQ